MTKEELNVTNEQFIERALFILNEIKTTAREKCVETLKQLGGSVEWDWQEDDAPSMLSINFADDVADCYITKAYLDEAGNIKVNLHAYYLYCDDYEDLLLEDEPNADYVDLLEYLNEQL